MQPRDNDSTHHLTQGRTESALAEYLEYGRLSGRAVDFGAVQSIDVDSGYRVQRAGRTLRIEAGERVVGYKIGLTSDPAQELFAADEPICGFLFDTAVVDTCPSVSPEEPAGPVDISVSLTGLIEPRLEVEIAFVLKHALEGAEITTDEVLAATETVALSLEIVGSRWAGGANNLGMLIADNSNAATVVLGRRLPVRELNLSSIDVELLVGQDSHFGYGTNVMGGPTNAVAWLAAHLSGHGDRLEAGQIVMSGTLTTPVRISPGDTVTAMLGDLAAVSVQFEN